MAIVTGFVALLSTTGATPSIICRARFDIAIMAVYRLGFLELLSPKSPFPQVFKLL